MSQPKSLDKAPDKVVANVVANPLRQRILATLRSTNEPCDIQHLATRFDVHANTVRAHLAVLEDAGMAASEPQPGDGPGRPRLVYRATARATEADTEDPGYRLLARMLVGHLSATAAQPSEVAQGIGLAWGRHLVTGPAPDEVLPAMEGIDRLVGLLDDVGFDPLVDTDDPSKPHIELRRCPFLDVARDHQDVVCAIHLGLTRGALDELGVAVEATALHPFVEPDRCVTDLAMAT